MTNLRNQFLASGKQGLSSFKTCNLVLLLNILNIFCSSVPCHDMHKNYDFIWEDDSTGEDLVIPNTCIEPIYTRPNMALPPVVPVHSFGDLVTVNDSFDDIPVYASVEPYQCQKVPKSPLVKLKGNSKKSSLRYVIIICILFL